MLRFLSNSITSFYKNMIAKFEYLFKTLIKASYYCKIAICTGLLLITYAAFEKSISIFKAFRAAIYTTKDLKSSSNTILQIFFYQ